MNRKALLWLIGAAAFIVGLLLRVANVTNYWASSGPMIGGALLILIYLIFDYKNVVDGLGRRSTQYGAAQGIMVVLVLGIVCFILAYSNSHSQRFDFTANKKFTLDDGTKRILADVTDEVKITVFVDEMERGSKENIADLLKQYQHANDKVQFEFIDPTKHPEHQEVMRYRTEIYSLPTIIVAKGISHEKTKATEEQDISNAIVRVTHTESKTVYFLTGHGEKSSSDSSSKFGYGQIKDKLEEKNYKIKDLQMERQVGVPADCAVLIIAGPTTDLVDYELGALDRYIAVGGKVILLFEPESAMDLAAWCKKYGLKVGNDMVCEAEIQPDLESLMKGQMKGRLSVSVRPVIDKYSEEMDITKDFQYKTQYPTCRSVIIDNPIPKGLKDQVVLETKGNLPQNPEFPATWAETDLESLKTENKAQFDLGQDFRGPVGIAALVTVDLQAFEQAVVARATLSEASKSAIPKEGQLLVFGDSDFAANALVRPNGDILLNSVNSMMGLKDLIVIDSKPSEDTSLELSETQRRFFTILIVALWPLTIVALGIGLALRRRRSS